MKKKMLGSDRLFDVASKVLTVLVILVLLISFTLFFFSCTGEAEPAPDKGQGEAIAFSVEGTASTTRTPYNMMTLDGAGMNEHSLRSEGFGVFASHTGPHPYVSTSTVCDLMWNQRVAYDGSAGAWTYSPLVYWPNGTEEDVPEYVTFFAYAPYSNATGDANSACIADFSLPSEVGDPWLLYQLGGSEEPTGVNGWKAKQVDLLYDFRKDEHKPPTVGRRVSFDFKHALACVGDQITVTASEALQTRLKSLYSLGDGHPVTITLDTLKLDYTLTRKGRLVLNSASNQPNWQQVYSEDPMVHRRLMLLPRQLLASATSSSTCTLFDYTISDQGIFYIPFSTSTGNGQKLTVTACYTLSTGEEDAVKTTIALDDRANSGRMSSLRLNLSLAWE